MHVCYSNISRGYYLRAATVSFSTSRSVATIREWRLIKSGVWSSEYSMCFDPRVAQGAYTTHTKSAWWHHCYWSILCYALLVHTQWVQFHLITTTAGKGLHFTALHYIRTIGYPVTFLGWIYWPCVLLVCIHDVNAGSRVTQELAEDETEHSHQWSRSHQCQFRV